MKKVLIIHKASIRKHLSLIEEYNIKEWIPLVSDYLSVKDMEDELKGIAVRKDISLDLQETAKSIRRPFYKVTARMGKEYNSLEWWSNSISERNTMVNKLFLRCCYVSLANQYLKKEENICIVCDNNSVIDNISSAALDKGWRVKRVRQKFSLQETSCWMFTRGVYKLFKNISRWTIAKVSNMRYGKDSKSPEIVLHTWVEEKCFGEDGKFKDRYFTILPEYYKKNGFTTATILTFFNIKRSFWKALKFFRKSEDSFIIPEDYYSFGDYFLNNSILFFFF